MATRNQSDAIRQELNGAWQQISGAFNFTYPSIAGFPRLLLHHDGSLYVLAGTGAILWLKPEYQINGGAWTDSGWGPDGGKFTFPAGWDGTIPLQCNRPCFSTDYPAGTVINTRVMARCSGSVVLCDSLLDPYPDVSKTWVQSESHIWNDAEDDVVAPDIVFALELENVGSPLGTGAIWGESNTNRHFLSIGGNRFVWAGSRRPGGEFPRAQTTVGSVAEDGQVTFGTLSEDTLAVNALSSNTYGVCSIGNNKFARFTSSNDGFGFAVWDCGASGLSATLLTNNYQNGVNTILPIGWRDEVLHSAGKMYIVAGDYAPDYNRCRMQVCDISNVSGVTSNRVDIDAIFGVNRTVYYHSGEQGEMQGRAIPGGGAMWIVKTADISDASSNPKMEVMISNGISVNRYQCSDLNGDPLALYIAADGVFAFAYRTTDGKIRVRVGKLTGLVPAFGDAFDIYGGTTGQQLYPADMDVIGDGKFVLAVQNYTAGILKQHYISFESDGISVSCGDTFGTHAMVTNGNSPIMLAQSGYAGKVVVGNYGRTGSGYFPVSGGRYVSMISLMPDPTVITAGTPVPFTVDASQEWERHYVIKATTAGTLTVDVTGMSAGSDLDLYLRKSLRATNASYDDSSENSGNTDEQCVVAVAEDDVVYVRLRVYANSSGTITATLS